jgi:hypothetical protein
MAQPALFESRGTAEVYILPELLHRRIYAERHELELIRHGQAEAA